MECLYTVFQRDTLSECPKRKFPEFVTAAEDVAETRKRMGPLRLQDPDRMDLLQYATGDSTERQLNEVKYDYL